MFTFTVEQVNYHLYWLLHSIQQIIQFRRYLLNSKDFNKYKTLLVLRFFSSLVFQLVSKLKQKAKPKLQKYILTKFVQVTFFTFYNYNLQTIYKTMIFICYWFSLAIFFFLTFERVREHMHRSGGRRQG